ncbi:enoyl-CoA hydratase/isomerase family protein [Halorarum salinum]|uniref:Enoyl-CoA hydratase/isomerase family protein n=1 Tax=Halorarum salinum TaxID=2743089 RepID=A0A7D5L941_9EURY|nr:enoyl-CoA hydratase/isomerase family protein [Halobaculum salinum]QLG61206.1 enoyl-CoA hydratase/isomerase family protein [Halobaculum salinum]
MIRSERADGGAYRVVTIDRPAARNALRPADLDALEAAVAEATEPVVLLRGAGEAFCAGADLDVVADLSDPAAFAGHGQRVARTIETADAVVVAGVDGAARGGGVELALACDVRIATPDASFAETGVRFGLFGAWGGTVRLPRVVREGDALEFALSGRTVDAEQARRIGLVSRVVDDPAAVAEELVGNEPTALAAVKTLLRNGGSTAEPEEAGGDDVERERAKRGRTERERAEREAFARLHGMHAAEIARDRNG